MNLSRVVRYIKRFNFDFHKVKMIDGKLYISQEQLDFFRNAIICQIINQVDNEAKKVRGAKDGDTQ